MPAIKQQPLSYTINEWLNLRRYSRPYWYQMDRADRPDVIGTGRAQRITVEADREWEQRQRDKAKAARQAAE